MSLPNLSRKSARQSKSSGFKCHPLEHECYLAKSLDFVRILSHGGRKTILPCAFEKVSRHIYGGGTRVGLPVCHVAFVTDLIGYPSKGGEYGHLLDLFLRIKRHVRLQQEPAYTVRRFAPFALRAFRAE